MTRNKRRMTWLEYLRTVERSNIVGRGLGGNYIDGFDNANYDDVAVRPDPDDNAGLPMRDEWRR